MRKILVLLLSLLVFTPISMESFASETIDLIDTNPVCRPLMRVIQKKTNRYAETSQLFANFHYDGTSIVFEGDPKAYSDFKSIQRFLSVLKWTKNPCYSAVLKAYAVTAVEISLIHESSNISQTVAFLANEGVIQPLPASYKKQYAQFGAHIFGAYDCTQTKIYIDYSKRPFDLGASILHEISHLFRDKFVTEIPIAHSIQSWLLLDETLASVTAGAVQWDSTNGYTPDQILGTGDFRLFDPSGNLNGIFYHIFINKDPGMPTALFNGTDSILPHLLGQSFLHAEAHNELGSEIQTEIQNIYQIVSQGYFGHALAKGWGSALQPQTNSLNYDPLTTKVSTYSAGLAPFSATLSELSQKLKSASPACLQFKQAIKNGELTDYISVKATKPGNEGVKTGNEGVKTGDEDAKPSINIKPCLLPGKGF